MKYFIVITFFLSTYGLHTAQACEIELCQKFLMLDNSNSTSVNSSNGLIKNSNCSTDMQEKVVKFLSQTHGTLSTSLLQKYFDTITFSPQQIEIKKLTQDLGIDYSKDHFVTFIEKVHFHKASLCVENTDISTSCDSCNSAGKKNITLTIRGNTTNFTIPIQAVLKTQVRAYMLERSFAPGERIESAQLKEIDLLTDTPAQTKINIDKIGFYSSTHNLSKGDILKTSDIVPATVIKPGKTCRVILKSENLNLQTEGRALQAATLGQSVQIELKHKIISASATNFDEATVEL